MAKEDSKIKHWYALYTRSNFERKVYRNLILKGFEAYCPLQKHVNQWSDRKKIIWKPVLRSYVLVSAINSKQLEEIRRGDGIVNFVYYNGKPGIIRDDEIRLMKSFLEDFKNESILMKPIQVGDNVSISSGPFMNYNGLVIDVDKKTVKLLIHILNMQLEVKTTIDKINQLQDAPPILRQVL